MKYLSSISLLLALGLTPMETLAAGRHQSGIIGQTALGEICDLDGNCVPNFVSMNVAISSDTGRLVADLATDDDGRFEIILKPGVYTLIPYFPRSPDLFAIALGGPIPVTIHKKEFTVTVVPFYPVSRSPSRPVILAPPPPSEPVNSPYYFIIQPPAFPPDKLPVTADEQRILEFLRTTTEFLSAREIGIAATPPGGCANPTWAQPCLIRLTKARVLEMNPAGQFRLAASERGHFSSATLAPQKAA